MSCFVQQVKKFFVETKLFNFNCCACSNKSFLDFFNVAHALAGKTDNINILPKDAMLLQKLLKGIRIAGFQKNRDLTVLPGLSNRIFGQICAGKTGIHKILFYTTKLPTPFEHYNSHLHIFTFCDKSFYVRVNFVHLK